MKSDRLNILTIMTDQHSSHVMGCYGNNIVRTPNLDRLAAEGMKFTNAYCPSPLCVPSRMSFMTSRTPTRNRVWNNSNILSSGTTTWAHALGLAGYETSLIGRMHFMGPDQCHGFENRPIGELQAGYPGVPPRGGPRWTRFPSSTSGQSREGVEIAGRGHTHYQQMDEERTEAALEYIAERAPGRQGRPFAAVLGYTLPHCPFIALKELFDYYYDRVDIPNVEQEQPASIRRFRKVRGILKPALSEERVRIARAAYFGLVEHVDRLIGMVLERLDETGLSENTLVVYCSDHGEMAGEHGCWWKSNYYEGSAGVPLIARLPGTVRAGAVCDAVCSLMDLGVTFADITSAEHFPDRDGRSLWPTLCGNHPDTWVNETYSELAGDRGGLAPSKMIRSGKWKLWFTMDCDPGKEYLPPALFNLEEDPDELYDLGQDPEYADIREKLLRKLRTGWDMETIQADAEDANASFRRLTAWGRAIAPIHPDMTVVPPPEYEADVELL